MANMPATSPETYSTTFDRFGGVDFTSSLTQVSAKRSPDANGGGHAQCGCGSLGSGCIQTGCRHPFVNHVPYSFHSIPLCFKITSSISQVWYNLEL